MSILVTGSSGGIGGNVVRMLGKRLSDLTWRHLGLAASRRM